MLLVRLLRRLPALLSVYACLQLCSPASAQTLTLAEASAEAGLGAQTETQRADLWINMLEAQGQRKKRESRWMLSMMSGGLATAFPAALVFDVFSSPRTNWTLGAAALPFAAGMVLGLAVPKHAERLTGSAVSLGIALSATAFAFEAADGPRDERPLMLGISVSLASSALSILLFRFLSDAHPERAFQAYRAQKDEERPRAAMGVLAQHDRKVRKGAGRAILAGLLSLGAVGIVAAATHDARAFAIGAPNQAGLIIGGVLQLALYRPLLESFGLGEQPTPGMFKF